MTDQPTQAPAPRTALEAAQLLVADGHHVHYVTEGQTRCLLDPIPKGGCTA